MNDDTILKSHAEKMQKLKDQIIAKKLADKKRIKKLLRSSGNE